jgi:hypothetical protein
LYAAWQKLGAVAIGQSENTCGGFVHLGSRYGIVMIAEKSKDWFDPLVVGGYRH